ncbi:SCP2 sterol-binding domain-containing protein [Psychromonas sp. MME2]|uniref:ubiquinone anaerobic biosynthesis accessory factor UbiT n=1 Tax=unclassified Psychromonas TaxID=2614957 RepID=UPI00339C396F
MLKSIITNLQHQLVMNTPKALALPASFVPFVIQKKLLSSLLDSIFAEAIEDGDLDFLEDKWLKVEVTDLQLSWYLSFAQNRLIIAEKQVSEDVSFSADINQLILIAGRKEDPDTLFFQRHLSIQGDTELGLEVKNLLDNIDFDNLPPLAKKALIHLSTFVQQGLIDPKVALAHGLA